MYISNRDRGIDIVRTTGAAIAAGSVIAAAVMIILQQIGGSTEMMQNCDFGLKIATTTFLFSTGITVLATAIAWRILGQPNRDLRIKSLIASFGLGVLTIGVSMSLVFFGQDSSMAHTAYEVAFYTGTTMAVIGGGLGFTALTYSLFKLISERNRKQYEPLIPEGQEDDQILIDDQE